MQRPLIFLSATASLMLLASGCTAQSDSVSAKSPAQSKCTPSKPMGLSEAGLSQVNLCIASGKKTHSFTAEVAGSTQEQAQGLMFRKSLADNAGMIFPFTETKSASFWMKNTLIPLDIIFIRADGSIESIAENTTPYSESPVSSGEPVKAVLEFRGGLTREMGIKAGDTVRW
jgi:uncharacterized protein